MAILLLLLFSSLFFFFLVFFSFNDATNAVALLCLAHFQRWILQKEPVIINTSSIYVYTEWMMTSDFKIQDTFAIFHDSPKDSVTDECYNDEDSSSHHSYYIMGW